MRGGERVEQTKINAVTNFLNDILSNIDEVLSSENETVISIKGSYYMGKAEGAINIIEQSDYKESGVLFNLFIQLDKLNNIMKKIGEGEYTHDRSNRP